VDKNLDITGRVGSLIGEEKALRERLAAGELTASEEQTRIQAIEVELDQCWDLLRQRAALKGARQNPNSARVRSADVVEGYES